MPLPPSIDMQVTSVLPGVDGNRILFFTNFTYTADGLSVDVNSQDGYTAVTISCGFTLSGGLNANWLDIADAVNSALGGLVFAEANDTFNVSSSESSGTGRAAAGHGVYYSGAVARARFRFPRYVKRYTQVGN